MPWKDQSRMDLRQAFVERVRQGEQSITALCAEYGISRTTGYTWLRRADADPADALADRSRTPHHQPRRSGVAIEQAVLAMRDRYPCWGGRKLAVKLREAGVPDVPSPSTITAILQRHGRIAPRVRHPPPTQRFEHAAPHDLWQMDFMGHRPLARSGRVHPLTILDDHSRMLLDLTAGPHQQLDLVWDRLQGCFQRYGLPRAILTDNGPPWGTSGAGGITRLEAWLVRLGIALWHGRPGHPQTQGKVERLHATIRREALGSVPFADLAAAQVAFDHFRTVYNQERPHEALAYAVPCSRMRPSPRLLPPRLPEPVYGPEEEVRKVRDQGAIAFAGRSWFVSRGLIGETVAVRPTASAQIVTVHFCQKTIGQIDLAGSTSGVTSVSEHLSTMSPV